MSIQRLGPYEIRRKLGRGGMGTVYEAVHRDTGETAAVKLLSAHLAQETGFRQRFAAEIETLRKLHHPNIVRLFGFGEEDEHLFYAMELVEGTSLEEQLSRGRRFEWREVTRIAIQTCHALRHAHDRGIIHRDIKPGNLLLADDQHVKLSDFGIARLFGNTRITGVGTVLGTAEFMAPEQAEGRTVEPRSDLYSLGVVMYVLLARRPVFQGASFGEILEKHRSERPAPLRRYAPDVPAELEHIIHELLEKQPERRVANAELLGRRLEAMEHALSLSRTSPIDDVGDLAAEGSAGTTEVPSGYSGVLDSRADLLAPTRVATAADSPVPPVLPPKDFVPPRFPSRDLKSIEPEMPKSPGRFVEVDAADLDQPEPEPAVTPWVSSQTWVLAAAFVAIGMLVWHLLQPPTADALYARISAQTDGHSDSSLVQAEDDIEQFLLRFPGDSRSEHLREHAREIELIRLERKLELRAKGLGGSDPLVPIEETYLEASNYARLDPDLGAARFQAMIDLYGPVNLRKGPTGRCLELAQRRLQLLRQQTEQLGPEHLTGIRDRLDEADQIRAKEPARAAAIYRGVVELYRDKPWAGDVVRRAQEGLGKK